MITVALCVVAMSAPADYRKNLNTFMEVERAFARTAVLKGYRDSFIEWFAEDGVGFNPHPIKQKEFLQGQPVEEKPFKSLISWEPKLADCASSGDLGFTSGPFKVFNLADPKATVVNGMYFSVWQKQSDGNMRVIFDLGTPTTEAPVYPLKMKVTGPPSPAFVTTDLIDRAKLIIKNGEDDISKSSGDELAKTIGLLYSKEIAVNRVGSQPILSSIEAQKWWNANPVTLKEWVQKDTRISLSGDFGFTWGKYSGTQGGKEVTGYFGHVWKCELGKGWHIVGDVMSVVP